MHGMTHRLTHRSVWRLALACAAFSMGSAWIVGCPKTSECNRDSECPKGEVCSRDGECIPETPLGEGEGERDAGFGGEGEGERDAGMPLPEIRITLPAAPPTMLIPDPFTSAGNALLATAGQGEDKVVRFRVADPEPSFTDVANFLNFAPGEPRCALDALGVFSASFLDLSENETWWSCRNPQSVRIQYQTSDAPATNLYEDPGVSALEVFHAYPSTDDPQVVGRIAFAPRDGALKILRISQGDQPRQARQFDDTSSLALNNVAAIYPVIANDPQLGDILLVYDRGPNYTAQRLVPIQRIFGQGTWSRTLVGTSSQFTELPIPAEAHFALFDSRVGIADLQGFAVNDDDQDTPNVVILLPTIGEVRFLRYEVEAVSPGIGAFNKLLIQGAKPTTNPPARDRVLLSPYIAGGRTYLFYSMTHQPFAWRLPMHDTRRADYTNEVIAPLNERANERYAGMVPITAVDAWFAGEASGEYFLQRMGFSVAGL